MNSVEKEHIEVNGSRIARLIISGEWLYDGIVSKPVRIFALNYDFYFDLDESGHDDASWLFGCQCPFAFYLLIVV